MVKPEGFLTQSEFAKLVGLSNGRITHLITKGQITPQSFVVIGKRRFINPAQARIDIEAHRDPAAQRGDHRPPKKKRDTHGAIVSHVSHVSHDPFNDDTVNNEGDTDAPQVDEGGIIPGLPRYQSSRARKEYYDAEIKRLAFEEKAGMLLSRKEVEADAFNLGRQVRDSLLNIPSRVADKCAASTDRMEVMNLLKKEITAALERLTRGV